MGVLAPRSALARPSAQPPIDTSGYLLTHMRPLGPIFLFIPTLAECWIFASSSNTIVYWLNVDLSFVCFELTVVTANRSNIYQIIQEDFMSGALVCWAASVTFSEMLQSCTVVLKLLCGMRRSDHLMLCPSLPCLPMCHGHYDLPATPVGSAWNSLNSQFDK